MYSIAKLLSDEPKKLESIILTVLKLLATIWIAQLFLGFDPDLSNFSIETFFKNFRVDESIYFVLTSIGVWYLLWEMLLDLIVDFVIKLFSFVGNSEKTLEWYLRITNSVKTSNDHIIDSKPNISHFTETIQDESEDYPFIVETRANQIFSVGLVSFIILLSSEIELRNWQIGLSIFLLINFFFVSIVQRKLHDFYLENAEYIRSKYYSLGQLQKVKEVIEQLEPLKSKFELKVARKRLELKLKSEESFLPSEISIVPLYFFNQNIGEHYIENVEPKMIEKLEQQKLSVICSNFYCSGKKLTKINDKIYCVNGESRSEIFSGFEELIYLLNSEHQKRKFEEASSPPNLVT